MKGFTIPVVLFMIFLPGRFLGQQRDIGYYIEQAKINSPFIHRNQNKKKLVQLDMEQLKSIYSRPEITIDAGVLFAPIISRDQNPAQLKFTAKDGDYNKYSGYDLAATDGGQYQALVSIRQGLFNREKLQTHSEKADISNRISDNNIELTNHELENTVRHQYILCLKSDKQAQNSKELMSEVDDEISTMQKLVDNAVYKKSDLLLLEITRQDYLQEYESFREEYKNNLYDLNLLCGITDTTIVQLADISVKKSNPMNGSSHFLKAYQLDSLSIAADLKISELKYKPEVNLFANGGMNAVYLPSINRLGFSTGITLNWTIFDGHQRETEQQKSLIYQENVAFEKQKNNEQNAIQKNYALSRMNSLDKRIMLANEQLNKYDELLKTYKVQVENATISVMDYKYLIKEIASKKQETLLMEMEKQLVINAYNYWNY